MTEAWAFGFMWVEDGTDHRHYEVFEVIRRLKRKSVKLGDVQRLLQERKWRLYNTVQSIGNMRSENSFFFLRNII